jgi:HJR/Mrr/RecB family endonuclease
MPWVRGPDRLPSDYGEKRKVVQKDLLKALKEAYPREYEKLIRAYFKSLAE